MRNQHLASKRILMLLENNPYPFDSRVRQEAQALVAAGYGVTVISPAREGQRWREIVDGVSVYRYPGPREGSSALAFFWEYGYSLLAMFLLSLWVLVVEGFDVVHAHNPPDMLCLIGMWYKMWGKRFVYDHHDLSPEIWEVRSGKRSGLLYRMLCMFEWLSCRVADHVIVTNESYRAIDRERNGVADWRMTTVRNGPDLRRVHQVPPEPWLVATNRPIIAYVGVLGPQDGVDYLVRSMQVLRDECGRDDVLCVIVGSGEMLPALKQLTSDLRLDNQIHFTGRLTGDTLMANLCAATLCVDPDPANSFNNRSTMVKMCEYMALGKPIVAFDLWEHRASAGESALYVPTNNIRAFAAGINELLNDPERQARMSQIALQRIHDGLAWHHSAVRLVNLYNDLLMPDGQRVQTRSVG
jgi:glycosyltransferase involved in cell wall biosynthesis